MSETGPAEPYFPGPWSQPVGSTPATSCDVALGRIRRDGTRGRGLAVAGIVFGCLWPTVVIALAILGGGSSASQSSADGAVRSAGGTSGAQPTPSTPGSLAPSPAGTPLTELADLPKAVADYRTPLVRAVDPAAREGALEGYRAVYTGPTGEVEIVARGWLSTEAANTWLRDWEAAAPRGASIERGDVLGAKGSTIGRSVLVRDDTAVGHCALAWRNQSTTLALTGRCGGVSAIFGRYPI